MLTTQMLHLLNTNTANQRKSALPEVWKGSCVLGVTCTAECACSAYTQYTTIKSSAGCTALYQDMYQTHPWYVDLPDACRLQPDAAAAALTHQAANQHSRAEQECSQACV
jgi:hypothetical protein